MALPLASVVLVLAACAAWGVLRRWRARKPEASAVLEEASPLSVHDKPTIEFSAYTEQLLQCADNDLPIRVAFEEERSTAKHTLDESVIEQLRGPESGIVALLRDPMKTREISCVNIDPASTGLPRPSAQARARAAELVAPRKRQS